MIWIFAIPLIPILWMIWDMEMEHRKFKRELRKRENRIREHCKSIGVKT